MRRSKDSFKRNFQEFSAYTDDKLDDHIQSKLASNQCKINELADYNRLSYIL